MMLYKGITHGSHWHKQVGTPNDPSTAGIGGSKPNRPHTAQEMIRHILGRPGSSRYTSFSSSYAVAHDYAFSTAGVGYILAVDTTQLPTGTPINIYDPVAMIVGACKQTGAKVDHSLMSRYDLHHNGNQQLILGIASPFAHRNTLQLPVKIQLGQGTGQPSYPDLLNAVVFALRDSELLVDSIPGGTHMELDPIPP